MPEVDEYKARAAQDRGLRAQKLLENELLKEAFATLESAYLTHWRGTAVEDVAAREKLFLAVNIVGKVQEHLRQAVTDGKLAEKDLKRIALTGERKLFRRY